MRDVFCVFLTNSFAVAQNTGAQNASTDQAAVGGIDISAADSTALASSGDITLLAE